MQSDEEGNVTLGNKIFNGDIVKVESQEDGIGVFLVVWDDQKGGWQLKHISGIHGTECPDAIKRIGTRWDNPELLKDGVFDEKA